MGRMRDGLPWRSIALEQRVDRCGTPQLLRCAADFSIAARWPALNTHSLCGVRRNSRMGSANTRDAKSQLCRESAIGGITRHAQCTAPPRS